MKTFRRLLVLSVTFVMMLSIGNVGAYAAKGKTELYWTLSDGMLTVSGEGEMPDYKTEVAPWREKDSKAQDVKSIGVEYGITHIGSQAFQYCESAKTVTIANSVKSFGDAAFYGCKKLKEVYMPAKLSDDKLPVSLFDHCTELRSIIVPDGVEAIKNAAFNCCESLEWVYIPATVEKIEDSAFNYCISLEDVYYGGSWTDWDTIKIEGYNRCLKNANIHFNCAPADVR